MDIRKRLTRKPLTTALWTILVAAMAMLLGVGCALLYSSGSLAGILDDYHTSIAVRTDRAEWETQTGWVMEEKSFTVEDAEYMESLDCVEGVYFHSLAGAYSPDFIPTIPGGVPYQDCTASYEEVMLIGQVTSLSPIQDYDVIFDMDEGFVGVYGELKIEEVILKNDDYGRYLKVMDEYLNFSVILTRMEEADYIRVGDRYVFFGAYDRNPIGVSLADDVNMTPIHPWIKANADCCLKPEGLVRIDYYDYDNRYGGGAYDAPRVYGAPFMKRIEGTFAEFLADPENALFVTTMERWERQQHSLPVFGTDDLNTVYPFVANTANIVAGRSFTDEEYSSGARVCVLNEAMALRAGISVGDTITMEQFVTHTQDMYTNRNDSVDITSHDGKLNNPNIGRFNLRTEYAPAEEFTVVGLYRLRNEWADDSYAITPNTVFIPNAAQIDGAYSGPSWDELIDEWIDENGVLQQVFKDRPEGCWGVYFSIMLKNGMVKDFEDLMAQSGRFSGQFITMDQGFGAVMAILEELTASAGNLTTIVLLGWLLLLALYLLLYQGKQRRNVGIMRSLGAAPREARRYLFGSGMAVAGIGIAIGTAVTAAVMDAVQSRLLGAAFASEGSRYSVGVLTTDAISDMIAQSQLPVWLLLVLMLGELAVFALVLRLHAGRVCSKEPRALTTK